MHRGAWAVGVHDGNGQIERSIGRHNLGTVARRALYVVLATVNNVVVASGNKPRNILYIRKILS